MRFFRSASTVFGGLLVLSYLTLTLMAFTRYPLPYAPASNWLSDLGSRVLNPAGALFYNLGIVITGLLLVLFFVGLGVLRLEGNRVQNLMLLLTRAIGILGACAMVMTAVFPIDQPSVHSFCGMIFRIATGTAFAFLVAALRYHAGCPRWLLALGVLTTATDLVVSVFFGGSYALEWVVIALFLCNVLMVGLITRRLSDARPAPLIAV